MISLTIANIIGFLYENWRLLAITAGVIALLMVFGLVMRSCQKAPVLDEVQIQKNQNAVASGERKKMEEALVESRTAEKQIDANRADADNQTLKAKDEARKEAKAMSNEDLAKTLEGLK